MSMFVPSICPDSPPLSASPSSSEAGDLPPTPPNDARFQQFGDVFIDDDESLVSISSQFVDPSIGGDSPPYSGSPDSNQSDPHNNQIENSLNQSNSTSSSDQSTLQHNSNANPPDDHNHVHVPSPSLRLSDSELFRAPIHSSHSQATSESVQNLGNQTDETNPIKSAESPPAALPSSADSFTTLAFTYTPPNSLLIADLIHSALLSASQVQGKPISYN